jgi:hypothetical protein
MRSVGRVRGPFALSQPARTEIPTLTQGENTWQL